VCDKHKQSKQTGVLPCTGTVPVVHGVRTSLTPPLICPLEVFLNDMRYINPRFTYLLTYRMQDSYLSGGGSSSGGRAPCSEVRSIDVCATVHDGLLHPHLRHCSSAASAVRRLPSAVCTATPACDVRSSGFFCGWPITSYSLPDYLPARSVTFL